jgi:hypothetical protein
MSGQQPSPLVSAVHKGFEQSVQVVTGYLTGSPRWSPEILTKVAKSDLVLCDLSVLRRDVFVEYGVAVGNNIPVIQCASTKFNSELPAWITNRQLQYYHGDDEDIKRFELSISTLLNTRPDTKTSWKRDSLGNSLEGSWDPRTIVFVGPPGLFNMLSGQVNAIVLESGFKLVKFELVDWEDTLEKLIKPLRIAGMAILAFENTQTDFLTCVAGGIFASKSKGSLQQGGKFERRMFLFSDLAPNIAPIPGLLKSHPTAETSNTVTALAQQLSARVRTLNKRLNSAPPAEKRKR